MARVNGFRGLAARARAIRKIAEKNINDDSRRTLLLGDQVFVLSTPVDEGTARASTQATIGAPATQVVEAQLQGDGGAAAALALAQARSALENYRALDQGTAFITQTTSYSVFLDKGSSRQAPGGMTKPAAKAMRDFVRSEFRVLRGV